MTKFKNKQEQKLCRSYWNIFILQLLINNLVTIVVIFGIYGFSLIQQEDRLWKQLM